MLKAHLAVTFGVSALLLSSCATKVEDIDAPISAPEVFRLSGTEVLPDQWWTDFNDPELDALIERALGQNFDLKAAWDRLSEARARVRSNRSGLWPTVTGLFGYQEQWDQTKTTTETSIDTDISNSEEWSVGLAADYEVDLWGRVRSGINAEVLSMEATEADVHAAAITLTANIATTWYEYQEQIAQITLLDEQIATAESVLQAIEARFRRGANSASDVIQQKQFVESRKEDRLRAVADKELLEITLAILIGEAPEKGRLSVEGKGLVTLPPLPETGIPASVVANRPDIRSAYLLVQSANQDVAVALAERYPRLTLSASFRDANERWRDLFDNWVATLAADLAVPILDGGARRAEVDRSRAVASEELNNYAQQMLEALGEVEQALLEEFHQHEVVASIEKQLEFSRQVTERIRSEYISGSQDFLRVLDSQQTQQNLERDLLTARRQLIGFRIDLCRALSSGWKLDNPQPDEKGKEPGTIYPLPLPIPGGTT